MSDAKIVGLLTHSPLHVGEGKSMGAIDNPIAREKHTGFPIIPGTGLKGAIRQDLECDYGLNDARISSVFGPRDDPSGGAGTAVIGEAQLAVLPVRSQNTPFVYVSCPHILRRISVGYSVTGQDGTAISDFLKNHPSISSKGIVSGGGYEKMAQSGSVLLEDLLVEVDSDEKTFEALANRLLLLAGGSISIPDDFEDTLVIVSDRIFAWLCRFAIPVRARNVLSEWKTSVNLWYEEVLPTDTFMWFLMKSRTSETYPLMNATDQTLSSSDWVLKSLGPDDNSRFIQVGGNETVGQGWVQICEVGLS